MKIGILCNYSKIKDENALDEFIAFIDSCGYATVRFSKPSEISGVDAVVILGGDGAILHSAVAAAKNGVKIIGINYGNLGFLTEYEREEKEKIQELLSQLKAGTCRILKRSILQCEIAGKTFYALNEISLQRDLRVTASQILGVDVQTEDGNNLVAGDGILICTPTGSTAYSLSAGGAILTPEVPVLMMTPICAFSMRARPIVFSDDETFTIQVKRGQAVVLADGLAIAALPENAEIRIKKAPFTADFPVRENSYFFTKVRSKLSE